MHSFWIGFAKYAPLWGVYILGQVVSTLMRADQNASMSKFTPWNTIRQYVTAHQNAFLWRFFLASALFWLWWHTPEDLAMIGMKKASLFPLNVGTAAIYGLFSDKVVNYFLIKFQFVADDDQEAPEAPAPTEEPK